jgi:hypothetical protein
VPLIRQVSNLSVIHLPIAVAEVYSFECYTSVGQQLQPGDTGPDVQDAEDMVTNNSSTAESRENQMRETPVKSTVNNHTMNKIQLQLDRHASTKSQDLDRWSLRRGFRGQETKTAELQ